MSIPVRGLLVEGRQYLMLSDMLLFFARIGETPGLTKSQRELIEDLLNALREVEVESVDWSEDQPESE